MLSIFELIIFAKCAVSIIAIFSFTFWTIITAHLLFRDHCVKSEVIVLGRGIFVRELSS